jgi:hypothetical protein
MLAGVVEVAGAWHAPRTHSDYLFVIRLHSRRAVNTVKIKRLVAFCGFGQYPKTQIGKISAIGVRAVPRKPDDISYASTTSARHKLFEKQRAGRSGLHAKMKRIAAFITIAGRIHAHNLHGHPFVLTLPRPRNNRVAGTQNINVAGQTPREFSRGLPV